jgi:glycerol-3-phosphate acyltransferase PlsX
MMTLIVDVMGFENDIKEAVDACRDFHIRHSDVNFLLIGNEKEISSCLKSSDNFFIKIFHTSEYVKMNDDPLKIIRNKNTSMYVALSKLVNNEGDGVLSAGNTGCFVALSYLLVKPINNISKPGFMPCIPTIKNNKNIYLIDVGANKECNGNDLYNFALMANLYCKNVCKIDSPKIGILNIGAEETKGFDFHKDGNELLKQNKKINYVGFVEPREIMRGNIDILVCDGYSGNLVLKTLEGSLKSVALVLKNSYKKIFN